jgi:N-acetylmuramoyl-L-alanine amidase CwlA
LAGNERAADGKERIRKKVGKDGKKHYTPTKGKLRPAQWSRESKKNEWKKGRDDGGERHFGRG